MKLDHVVTIRAEPALIALANRWLDLQEEPARLAAAAAGLKTAGDKLKTAVDAQKSPSP